VPGGAFGEGLEKAINAMLDDGTTLVPSPVGLVLAQPEPITPLVRAASTTFALGAIATRKRFSQGVVLDEGSALMTTASKEAPSVAYALGTIANKRRPLAKVLSQAGQNGYDVDVVRSVYGMFVDSDDPESRPTLAEGARARAVLHAGWR